MKVFSFQMKDYCFVAIIKSFKASKPLKDFRLVQPFSEKLLPVNCFSVNYFSINCFSINYFPFNFHLPRLQAFNCLMFAIFALNCNLCSCISLIPLMNQFPARFTLAVKNHSIALKCSGCIRVMQFI